MPSSLMRSRARAGTMTSSLVLLAACGGGSSPDTAMTPQVSINGVAAMGGALADATVSAKCVGAMGQARTGADGSYSLRLAGASLPCVLRANDGKGKVLHSVAQDRSASTVAHITPLTDLLLTRTARLAAASVFDSYSAQLAAGLSVAALSSARGEVVGLLNGTVDTSTIADFVRSDLKAGPPAQAVGDPHNQVLEKFAQRVTSARYAEWARMLAGAAPLPGPGPFTPELRLSAASIHLAPGQTVPLSADLNYPPHVSYTRPPLTWRVMDSDGGQLGTDAAGRATYTAPSKRGAYRVNAMRDDYANVSTTLTVNVADFSPILEVAESVVTLMPGQIYRFSANVNAPAGVPAIGQPVSWRLLDAEGGSITSDGVYTAPPRFGTFRVQARRTDYPEKAHTVEVRVGHYQSLDRYALALQYVGLDPERQVIRDAAAWAAWKQRHRVDLAPRPDDEVDFSKHMVVAIVWPTLQQCYTANVLDLGPSGNALQATIQILAPGPDVACTAVVWNPVWLLVTARSDLPLVVVER